LLGWLPKHLNNCWKFFPLGGCFTSIRFLLTWGGHLPFMDRFLQRFFVFFFFLFFVFGIIKGSWHNESLCAIRLSTITLCKHLTIHRPYLLHNDKWWGAHPIKLINKHIVIWILIFSKQFKLKANLSFSGTLSIHIGWWHTNLSWQARTWTKMSIDFITLGIHLSKHLMIELSFMPKVSNTKTTITYFFSLFFGSFFQNI
jgi:hypothetical protein